MTYFYIFEKRFLNLFVCFQKCKNILESFLLILLLVLYQKLTQLVLQEYGPVVEPPPGVSISNEDDYRSPSEDSGLGMGISDRVQR
jgi:hypothetical protein